MVSQLDGNGNTRLTPQTVSSHLDYLRVRVCLQPDKFALLLEFVGSEYLVIVPHVPWTAGRGCPWFENTIGDCIGINGGYTEDSETGLVDVMLEFSGQYFDAISVVNQWRLLRGLKYTFQVRCTRIDCAISDYSYEIIPVSEMVESFYRGEHFHFKCYKHIISGTCPEDMKSTDYYGSRHSGRMIRVYEHNQECMRFETEFKRGFSQLIFDALATIEKDWFIGGKNTSQSCMDAMSEWSKKLNRHNSKLLLCALLSDLHGCNKSFDIVLQNIIASIAVNSIDFRDRSSRKDTSKASYKDTTRMEFYQKFIETVGFEMRVKICTKKSSIQKTVAWMQRQVSKTLSIIRDSLGIVQYTKWQSEIMNIGREKQSIMDLKMIAYIQDNPSVVSLY